MNWFSRIKSWCIFYKQEIGLLVIIALVASVSFGLGYLANREFGHVPIVIEQHISTSTTP